MKFIISIFTSLFLLLSIPGNAQRENANDFSIDAFLHGAGVPEAVKKVIADTGMYEPQIIYIRIDRDDQNNPLFTEYRWNVDSLRYFYPASTVKMPVAVLALEKLNDIAVEGVHRDTRLEIDSIHPPQTSVLVDPTAREGIPTIGHYIQQVFVVSKNDAFNRLYEFVGQDEVHYRLRARGIARTRILHRLGDPAFGHEDNRHTNRIRFMDGDDVLWEQTERHANLDHPDELKWSRKGRGFITEEGDVIHDPFDFSRKNFFPLDEQVGMLQRVLFPESYPEYQRFRLTPDDYRFLYAKMGMLPRESAYPAYRDTAYSDSYVKFFMYGGQKDPIPDHIRIFNKVGWAYGYLTDCAYIVDIEHGVEFILAATVHVNENQIYNDGEYEYETIGLPYLSELGRMFYEYELNRLRKNEPDLVRFSVDFEEK